MNQPPRDHGGGLDAAIKLYGGERSGWLDLSTGINPVPYPIPNLPQHFWTDLPDNSAQNALLSAAHNFWNVPKGVNLIAASGVSALIAQLPRLATTATVGITRPSYNEHEAAFRTFGWNIAQTGSANVYVHPNNPDGRLFTADQIHTNHRDLTIIDESFCDICPEQTLIEQARTPGIVILKGLGKFWGLAGLRLGFAIALPDTIRRLNDMLGPWAISGPAQFIGATALRDVIWATQTRARLKQDAKRLDEIMSLPAKGTDLFRLYSVKDATHFQTTLARHQIWSRIFPYSKQLLRLGLPATEDEWVRLATAVNEV